MKIKFLSCVAILALLVGGCQKPVNQEEKEDNKQEQEQVPDDNGGNNGEENKPLSQQDLKERLQAIGLEVLDYADLDKWKGAFLSFMKIPALFDGQEYNTDAFERLEDIAETGKDFDRNNYGYYGWGCDYLKAGEEILDRSLAYRFSKLKGKFTLDNVGKKWMYEEASAFAASAEVEGETLTLTGEIKDASQKTRVSEYYNRNSYSWSAFRTGPAHYMAEYYYPGDDYVSYGEERRSGGSDGEEFHIYNPVTGEDMGWVTYSQYYYNYADIIEVPAGERVITENCDTYLYMPEKVTALLSSSSGKLAEIEADLEYKGAKAGEFDLASDQIGLGASFSVAGYTLKVTKADLFADNADAEFVLSWGETPIVTIEAKETGHAFVHNDREDSGSYSYDGRSEQWEQKRTGYTIGAYPKSAEVSVDILGKLLLKGNVDITKVLELGEEFEASEGDELKVKAIAAAMEEAIKLEAFFDGSTVRAAYFGVEPLIAEEGSTVWTMVPVIRFEDGSAYALPEVFFNEEDFADLITGYSSFSQRVDEFFNEFFPSNQETVLEEVR